MGKEWGHTSTWLFARYHLTQAVQRVAIGSDIRSGDVTPPGPRVSEQPNPAGYSMHELAPVPDVVGQDVFAGEAETSGAGPSFSQPCK